MALISGGEYVWSPSWMSRSSRSFSCATTVYGSRVSASWVVCEDHLRPISRLTLMTVRSALVTAWRRARPPTSRFPFLAMATTEGVSRCPARFGITTGVPDCTVDTTEFVVPRSMPMTGSAAMLDPLHEFAGLLVIFLRLQDARQLRARLGLEPQLDEHARQQHAHVHVVRRQLHGFRGEGAGLAGVAQGIRAAGRARRRDCIGAVHLHGLHVDLQRRLVLGLLLELARGAQRELRARTGGLALQLDELLSDLLAARIQLARRLEHRDGVGA